MIAILLATTAAFQLASVTGTNDRKVRITLSVMMCPPEAKHHREPSAVIFSGNRSMGTMPLAIDFANLRARGVAAFPPGHYSIGVVEGRCSGSAEVTVLPGRDRNVGVIAQQGNPIYDAHAYLAGTLPIGSVSSAFLTQSGQDIFPVIIDGEAYYGEHLRDGKYTLVLNFASQDLEAKLEVVVEQPGSIHNITMGELAHSIGYPLRYHGQPQGFRLLWSDSNR